MRRTRVAFVALLALGAGAAGYYYFHREEVETSATAITLYGNIDIRHVDLPFHDEGRLEQMRAEEGDEVHKGQLLATLESSRYEAAVNAATAQVALKRALFEKLVNGSRPEDIDKARADVAAAEATLADTRLTLRRKEELAKNQFAAQQAVDDARVAMQTATARLDALKATLALVVKGPRDEDIAAAKADLEAAEAGLVLAQRQLFDTSLYAPEDGVILTRIAEPGAVVSPTSPVYTLTLSNPLWARTYVPETLLGKVYPGMPARIRTDSFPDRTYKGWVGFISPVAEFTPKTVETLELRSSLVYRARVYVENQDKTLRQGMPVTVILELGAAAAPEPGTGESAPKPAPAQ